ncbi:phage tail tape measure protein [Riemerella anatipestifer]|nr:phage tail tape measure protein [Riemerella anatipestifer]MBT0572332.1 phage tail tape measure protein [Riemerella anatipestifer]MDR7797980.1 phage tail tape measure protein [Riemerella anatipestifer]MDY3434299.1 phage tail tape measure protein [Riemerella anatipestifer]MDY3441043.1 phage tail tape measure protein [Riemerella anatipestifer]MDY3445611.1 phage tail tape measure protein [Riemerella anatipestifer]
MAKEISSTIVLKVNGKEVDNSFNGLRSTVSKFERELKKLTPGTKEFIQKAAELKEARAEFEKVKNEITAVNNKLSHGSGVLGFFRKNILEVGTTFRQVFTANIAANFFDNIISKSKYTVDELLNIADAMSDVQKTTGMALGEVKQLWDEFDKMDTRTSKLDRLKIAEVGGRLGVPKEEMASFVQEIDKAYVALGDSFQEGLENVVDSLGKIKGLFNETKGKSYAEAINEVGSALNELAANGTASEGNISDFALRVGALPDAIKPSIDKVLGLGAGFEEAGIDAQIASSGFTNFMKVAGEGLSNFAYSMNMSVAEAQKLFNEKPEEFFLRFAEGMKGLLGDETIKIFESLKLNSLEVQKAVGAAANRTDEFREAMKRSSSAMAEATSLSAEFNTKNNNAPAIIEKLKNAWNDMFSSTNILNKFEWLIELIGWVTGVTKEAGDGVLAFKQRMEFLFNIIKVVGTAIVGYNASILIASASTGSLTKATWLNIVADKAKVASMALLRVGYLLYNMALALVTLNINRAREAMMIFNITAKASPLGVLITLVTTAYMAYKAFSKEVDNTTKKQKLLNSVTEETNKNIISQKNELDSLLKIAKDETIAKERRLSAIKKLNEISPEYLGNLTLENINTKAATEAINKYTNALYRNARAKVLKKKMDEKMEQIEDMRNAPVAETAGKDWLWKLTGGVMKLTSYEAQNLDPNMFKQMEIWKAKGGDKYAKEMMKSYGSYYDKALKNIQKVNDDFNVLANEYTELMKQDIVNDFGGGNNGNQIVPDAPKRTKNRPAKNTEADKLKEAKKDLEDSQKAYSDAYNKLLEMDSDYYLERQKLAEKSLEAELAILDAERSKELNSQRKYQDDILKTIEDLEEKKKNAKSPEAAKNYEKALEKERSLLALHDKIVETSEEAHGHKVSEIKEKWITKRLSDFFESERLRIDKERASDDEAIQKISTMEEAKLALSKMTHLKLTQQELLQIKTLEDAKKALREDADRKMLESQLASLELQKEALEESLKGLTGEAAEKLKKDLDELNIRITQVKGAIQGNKENDEHRASQERRQQLSQVDLLGFSADQWEDMFKNLKTTEGKIKAVQMATQALSNAFNRFAQLQQNLNEREMQRFTKNQDKKRKALLVQLNQGLISQEEYHKGIEALDTETAKKKSEIAHKQAVAEKAFNIANAIMSTALAVTKSLPNIPLSIAVGALGAIQVATIASTPLPEKESFAKGGYTGPGYGSPDKTGKRPAGIVHGNEYVTPDWMLENPIVADTVEWMEAIRTGRIALPKGYADGGFVTETTNPNGDDKTKVIYKPVVHYEMKKTRVVY